MTSRSWTVRLSEVAETDYDEILRWTAERFGDRQAVAYGARLAGRVAGLEGGPDIAGARKRDEIGTGLRTLHIGSRGRHIILFRIGGEADRTIDELRILPRKNRTVAEDPSATRRHGRRRPTMTVRGAARAIRGW